MNRTKKKDSDYITAIVILLVSSPLTYVATMMSAYTRGYLAVGGEAFLPLICIALSCFYIFRRA